MEILAMFNQLSEKPPQKPRLKRIDQYYSKEYFHIKVKPTFEVRWTAYCAEPDVEGPRRTLKRLDFQNKVTKEFWDAESPAFREWLTGERDQKYKAAMEEYEKSTENFGAVIPNKSAEMYHK